jgi:hypothetical protein
MLEVVNVAFVIPWNIRGKSMISKEDGYWYCLNTRPILVAAVLSHDSNESPGGRKGTKS